MAVRMIKYGGSVLRSVRDIGDVADDILGLRGENGGLVVVVSAFEGRTTHLMYEARALGLPAESSEFAGHVCVGEFECAAALLGALKARRVDAVVATPARIGFIASGERLDAEPESLDRATLQSILQTAPVLIVPGYSAVDLRGKTVLLGRGGSDLSAIFIAAALRIPAVRLVKDVDAVFDRDPNEHAEAQRLDYVSYDKALEIAGELIQPKALRHAREAGIAIEIAGLGKSAGTIIGPGA